MSISRCHKCGAFLNEQEKTCHRCGAIQDFYDEGTRWAMGAQAEFEETQRNINAGMAQPTQQAGGSMPPYGGQMPPYGGTPQYTPSPTPSNKNTPLYVIIIVLLLIAVAFAAFFFFTDKSSPSAVAPPKTDTIATTSTSSPTDTAATKTTAAATPPPSQPKRPQPNPDQYNQTLHLTGAIGPYPIVIDMDIAGGNISGSYYYRRNSSKNRLYISGTYDPSSGYMSFYECNKNGTYTGDFSGTFNGISFSGVMSAYASGKTYNTSFKKQ